MNSHARSPEEEIEILKIELEFYNGTHYIKPAIDMAMRNFGRRLFRAGFASGFLTALSGAILYYFI